MAFAESALLRERREHLVASLRAAYGYDAECYRRTSNHLDEIRLVWNGNPSTGVSSQISASGDRRGYTAELVVLVEIRSLGSITNVGRAAHRLRMKAAATG